MWCLQQTIFAAWHLTVHKRTPSGDKPCECDVCNKRFSRSHVLTVHKRTHTEDKPYQCDVCNKRFSESHKLTQHKVSAHKSNLSFECGICKKIFTKRQSLKHHWRSHLRDGLLLCHTCGKEIIQGQGHANEILSDDHFLCDKCDKQFPDIESLYQHKAKDHGTSYQCDVCIMECHDCLRWYVFVALHAFVIICGANFTIICGAFTIICGAYIIICGAFIIICGAYILCANFIMCKLHYVQISLCANFIMCKLHYVQTSLCANFIMCKLHYVKKSLCPQLFIRSCNRRY